MIINMTTIALRQTHYVDRTLESLRRSDGRHVPVNLILGSSDTSHVEKYRETLNIVPWDEEDEARAITGKMRHNCNLNAIRALKYGDDEYCVCCEDDIHFTENWFSQLMLTIAEIRERGEADYVLNLGQRDGRPHGKRYAIHTKPFLCGAQAIFYPSKGLRSTVAAYLERNITKGLNDDLVGRYAKRFAALYNTTPCLVGHIGQVSSFTQPKASAPRTETRAASSAKTSVADDAVEGWNPSSGRATAETLVALLRASLGSGPPPDPATLGACDWRRLAVLATDHALVPAAYQALSNRTAGVPPEWLKRFKAQYVTNVFRNQLARTVVDEIGAAFASEGIRVVLTEGAAFARMLHEDPGVGIVDGIDLLVDEADVGRADARLHGIGFKPAGSEAARRPPSRIHLAYHRSQPPSLPLELRWRLFEPYRPYVFDLDAARAQARELPDLPPNVRVMAPEHELAHLCLRVDRRAVAHRSLIRREDWFDLLLLPRGPGWLLGLYEIAAYLQKRGAGIDWDRFVQTARGWAIDGYLHAPLELCRRTFGIGPSAEVLRGLDCSRPRFVERLAHGLRFASDRADQMPGGRSARARRSRLLAQWSGPAQRLAHAWISVFPPRAYLQARYPTAGAPLASHGRHVRQVLPWLWAEARYRLSAAGASSAWPAPTIGGGDQPRGR